MRARGLVLAVLALSGCGEPPAELRLRPTPGRELVYDAARSDDWADAELGYGGVLSSEARLRLTCIEAVPGRAGTYEVVVDALAVSSPERFGVHVDTRTADPEPGDRHGSEELVRRLVRRRGELEVAVNGGAREPEPDRELRGALREWGAGEKERQPVMMLLDELLDGPRVTGRWTRSCGRLLPDDPRPELPLTWSLGLPPIPSLAGSLAITLEVTATQAGPRLVTISARGEPALETASPDAVVDFESGSMTITLQLDVEHGVVREYVERASFVFRKRDDAKTEMPVSWERSLRLVD